MEEDYLKQKRNWAEKKKKQIKKNAVKISGSVASICRLHCQHQRATFHHFTTNPSFQLIILLCVALLKRVKALLRVSCGMKDKVTKLAPT